MRLNLSITVFLFLLWLAWSGEHTLNSPLLLGFGLASCALILILAARMRIADSEGHPSHIIWQAVFYAPWLAWAIVKANIDVTRRILSPSLPISPTLVKVRASQHSDLGRVIFANSITLTPGTVSIDVEDAVVTVHALTREAAAELAQVELDRRVTAIEAPAGT